MAEPTKPDKPRTAAASTTTTTTETTATRATDDKTTAAAAALTPTIGPYIPNSGPPPPRISLLPPDSTATATATATSAGAGAGADTTGYIIDKLMLARRLPGRAAHETQLIAVYYVGYGDRPRARALVPYFEILRHVSPRRLEEWEDGAAERAARARRESAEALRREREREREEDLRLGKSAAWTRTGRGAGENAMARRGKVVRRVTRGVRRRMVVE